MRHQDIKKYPEIIKRMYDEGHVIGNNTFYYTQMTAVTGKILMRS
jgi:peptidoglycan/xylan/chitin deacetylase (PgdA/CDA1 family)